MPTSIRFIDSIIKNLKISDTRQTYWCDGCPGFGLRIMPSGKKSFVFKYMNGRTSRWITIGRYPEWSIRKARREYDQFYEQVHEYGRDPVQEIQDEIKKQNTRKTVSQFITVYLELMHLKEKASIKEEERVFNLDVKPLIGNKFLDEVTSNDIENIQTRILKRAKKQKNAIRSGKVAVKNSLAYTRQLFNLAKKKGLIDNNPVMEVESLGVSGSRSRVLNFQEIWLFWNRVENIGIPPVTAKALKFMLATMQRGIEVRNMKHSSFKKNENIWQMEIHETKNRTMHRVPMNKYAKDILEQVNPYTGVCPYVFGATKAMSPPKPPNPSLIQPGKTAFSQAIRKNREEFGIEDFCPHDLRRTGATWITAAGLPKLYARLLLNHNDGDKDVTGEVYVQLLRFALF